MQKQSGAIHDRGVRVEDGGKEGGGGHHDEDHGGGDGGGHQDGGAYAAPRALHVPRAEVLPDEGRYREGKRLRGQKEELVDLGVGGPTAERRRLIEVDTRDIGLHEDVGEGGKGKLDGRGNADQDDGFKHRPVHFHIL